MKKLIFPILLSSGSMLFIQGQVTDNTDHHLSDVLNPEPAGWYSGDIHVHRNCGNGTGVTDIDKFPSMMEPNNLAVISVLADMGNGEVKYSAEDLMNVNGGDAPGSKPGHIIHWDAEWHWDATYSNFSHQALGGHLVVLGLKNAHQIWNESDYKILEWARQQHAVSGFAHFEYLKDSFQNELNCCIPVEYPVEAALGTIDFVSEDVFGSTSPNNGNYNSEAVLHAYYKLLNCGFRLGLAAGTDFPCNESEPLGTLLTYVQVKDKDLTYDKWIAGIKNGRTVVSRNGHNEFIELKVDGNREPGDEIKIKHKKLVRVSVKWTGTKELKGTIELVCNGKVIASQPAFVSPGKPFVFNATQDITESSWICARRMDEKGHESHTAPVYFTVDKKPVRANAEDARYFIDWIDRLLVKTSPGGAWNRYFTHDLDIVQGRYRKAKSIFSKILEESQKKNN
ncbi:MAG: CehA/McbA family metallohydrolase [Chitinophagales bacterium]